MPTSTHIFRVDGMHCGNCSLLIDDTLEDLPGVSRSYTEVKAGRSAVQLDTSLTDTREVIDSITGLGYTASEQP
ncbi:heavy-metal-associated domain-containing protein [Mycobacterium sp. AZCC_0083]|uniref:heavy-metal-associated domain-containing protein n=1 Tax=Mycobacterium sp. AZCC_0083 TaxID=2735882 RepID=UPI0016157D4B|nr:heavy-metal-associated domain-containing protein [Mycobacterium sp. AZCC_0083]MBB5161744.1 copper chaperone CopZ [Mycobacterium sp. AZCC_0083]